MAKKRSKTRGKRKKALDRRNGKKREQKELTKRARNAARLKKRDRHAVKHSKGQGKRDVKKDKPRAKSAHKREAPVVAPETLAVVGANARVLSHLDKRGHTRMVDVSAKKVTAREATAEGYVVMEPATLALIQANGLPKGDVLAVARVAGIMAAKKTSDIIPMCHPLQITGVNVDLAPAWDDHLRITATVKVKGKTGVEMEALTAVSAAALTVYDMCKAVDRGMRIEGVRLLEKMGGRSGHWIAER